MQQVHKKVLLVEGTCSLASETFARAKVWLETKVLRQHNSVVGFIWNINEEDAEGSQLYCICNTSIFLPIENMQICYSSYAEVTEQEGGGGRERMS